MGKLKLGLIGLGTIYPHQKMAFAGLNNIEIVALCDRKETKLREESASLGVAGYLDYKQLLTDSEAEAVLLSTPLQTHFTIGTEVLKAGKHLVIEKPAAIELSKLQQLQETAVQNGVKFITAFHAAFASDLLWFRENGNSLQDQLGPVTQIDCQFFDPYVNNGVMQEKAGSLGGSWIDSGVNALSVLANLVDINSVKIKQKLLVNRKDYKIPNVKALVELQAATFQNTACEISINTDWTLEKNYKVSTLYYGETGSRIVLHHTNQMVLLINQKEETNTLADFSSLESRLVAQYKALFQDMGNKLEEHQDNYSLSLQIHKILMEAF